MFFQIDSVNEFTSLCGELWGECDRLCLCFKSYNSIYVLKYSYILREREAVYKFILLSAAIAMEAVLVVFSPSFSATFLCDGRSKVLHLSQADALPTRWFQPSSVDQPMLLLPANRLTEFVGLSNVSSWMDELAPWSHRYYAFLRGGSSSSSKVEAVASSVTSRADMGGGVVSTSCMRKVGSSQRVVARWETKRRWRGGWEWHEALRFVSWLPRPVSNRLVSGHRRWR